MRVDEIILAGGPENRSQQNVLVEVPSGLSSQLPLTGSNEPAARRSLQDDEIAYSTQAIAARYRATRDGNQ